MEIGERLDRAQAAAFLRALGATRSVFGGQLLVGEPVAGWLLGPPEARLARPDRIEWRANRGYREGSGDFPFMPPELVADRPPALHAFVRIDGGEDFAYAGEGRIGSYGYMDHRSRGQVSITLTTKLAWETWLLLGGKPGFSVSDVGDGLDAEAVETSVRDALASGDAEIWITDYSDVSLTLLVNRERVFVMLLRGEDDPGLLAGDPAAAGDSTLEHFRLDNGQVDEFERSTTVTHEQAIGCVRSFLHDHTLGPGIRPIAG